MRFYSNREVVSVVKSSLMPNQGECWSGYFWCVLKISDKETCLVMLWFLQEPTGWLLKFVDNAIEKEDIRNMELSYETGGCLRLRWEMMDSYQASLSFASLINFNNQTAGKIKKNVWTDITSALSASINIDMNFRWILLFSFVTLIQSLLSPVPVRESAERSV